MVTIESIAYDIGRDSVTDNSPCPFRTGSKLWSLWDDGRYDETQKRKLIQYKSKPTEKEPNLCAIDTTHTYSSDRIPSRIKSRLSRICGASAEF